MAFTPPQGNKTVMVDNNSNIVYPASFTKVITTQATISGNNFTSVPSVIDPASASTTQLPSVASVVNYVADVVEGGSSGVIPAIQSSIQSLKLSKINRGAFYFGGAGNGGDSSKGDMIIRSGFGIPLPFSVALRVRATNEQTGTLSYLFRVLNGIYIARQSGLRVEKWNSSGQKEKQLVAPTNIEEEIFDGNWHSIIVTCTSTTLSLYYEKGLIVTGTGNIQGGGDFTDIQPSILRIGGGGGTSGFGGQISSINVFNFDMSDNNALYTIDDYINGKDESPMLKGGASYSANSGWYSRWGNGNVVANGDSIDITMTKDEGTSNMSIVLPSRDFIGGQSITASYDSVESSSEVTIRGLNLYVTNNIADNKSFVDNKIELTTKISGNGMIQLIVICNESTIPNGTMFSIKGLKINVNGALLSLDDYSIRVGATQIVPDVSGNLNDATITGAVYGSKDNSIARLSALIGQANA